MQLGELLAPAAAAAAAAGDAGQERRGDHPRIRCVPRRPGRPAAIWDRGRSVPEMLWLWL